jgi:hypothetical protein
MATGEAGSAANQAQAQITGGLLSDLLGFIHLLLSRYRLSTLYTMEMR